VKSGLYRRSDGVERLWFTPQDVEAMMEAELKGAALYPTLEKPVVELERFVARHLRVALDQHADLEPHVLGLTEFFPNAAPKIRINRDLTDAIDDDETPLGLRGRWRATLAHEASHVVMHRVLFEVASGQESLFRIEGTGGGQLMRCLKTNVLFRAGGSDWREVQANMGMAALLMPERFFVALVADVLREKAIEGPKLVVGSSEAAELAAVISNRCAVSRQAAQIRLETTRILSPRGQGCLLSNS
jgi:hypothetical protein